MDRIRFSLISVGLTLIAAGALLLYAAAGIGRWFALGAMTGGALVLGGIALASLAGAWLRDRSLEVVEPMAASGQDAAGRPVPDARGR